MNFLTASVILVVLSLFFAWNMGAHYTGAVMGMAYGSRSIRLWPALILIAVFTIAGATFLSHNVEVTVGHHIIDASLVTIADAIIIVLVAGGLTTLFTAYRIPSSTIQILVFSVVGVGSAAGIHVNWRTTMLWLISTWIFAPIAAVIVGFVLTKLIDRLPQATVLRSQQKLSWLSGFLILVSIIASITLGANDVSNASGVLLMTHLMSPITAGLVMGAAMAIGVLTWGKPLLHKVGFDIVKVDLSMATAAQFSQSIVVFTAASLGLFTSMNQSLVGAMTGAGLARGGQTIDWKSISGIIKGWIIAPISGFCAAYLLYYVVHAL